MDATANTRSETPAGSPNLEAAGFAPLGRLRALGKSALILPAAFLSATALGVIALGMVYYARDAYGASAAQVGLLVALPHLAYVIGCFAMRPPLGRMLPRHSMLTASLTMAVTLSVILLTRSPLLLFALYTLFGLADSLFWPPLMGWLSSGKEDQLLNRAIARFNLMWSSGTILGPLLGGVLVERGAAVALRAGVLMLVGTALVAVVVPLAFPRVRGDRSREPVRQRGGSPDRGGSPLRHPAWVGLFAGYVVFGVLLSVFPLFARDDLGLPESQVGILLLLRTLFATVGFVVLGRTELWHHRFLPMAGAQVGLILVLLLMIRADGFLAYGAMLGAMGLLLALIYNSGIFHGTTGSRERTRRMAIQEGVLTAGVVAGSAFGGGVYQGFAMTGTIFFCLAVVGGGLAVQGVLYLLIARGLRGRRGAGSASRTARPTGGAA
jgi:predicted MFS family arabinose efflux permease